MLGVCKDPRKSSLKIIFPWRCWRIFPFSFFFTEWAGGPVRLRCDPGQLAHWHPLPGKQEQLIRRWQWNMDQIHQRSGQRDAKPRPWRFRNSYLLQSTVLSGVAEDESPGGQASNSLQILAAQSGPPLLATEGPQREASVRLQKRSFCPFVSEELQVPALCQWGPRWAGASGTRPLSQQLCWSRAVLPLPRLHCPWEPAHQHISSFTYHPQLGGSISFWGDFPCLSSVSHHMYCTYHFSLSSLYSLKYILQLKALCKLKSPLQNQN